MNEVRDNLQYLTIKGLRHTNATIMIAKGTGLKTVSRRLGHSNTNITMRIYNHEIAKADEIAADILQDVFSRK